MERLLLMIACIGFSLWVSNRRFEHVLPFRIVRRKEAK